MPKHEEEKYMAFTPEQMFALVADIDKYPDFLPWCLGARVVETTPMQITADLIIGYKGFRESFRSHVSLDKPKTISVAYGGGPLKSLTNRWSFAPAPDGKGCLVNFFVDFEFKSSLMEMMMRSFFDQAFAKMVEAFETRAEKLYGAAAA